MVSLTSKGPATLADVSDAARVDEVARQMLPNLRKSAENWRNGLGVTSVVGAVSAVYVSSSGELVRRDGVAASLIMTAFILMLAFAAFSLALSLYASFGWPTTVSVSRYGAWERKQLVRSSNALRASIVLGCLAVLAAAVASTTYFVTSPRNVGLEITTTSGTKICADRLAVAGSYLSYAAGQDERQILLTSLESVRSTVGCA